MIRQESIRKELAVDTVYNDSLNNRKPPEKYKTEDRKLLAMDTIDNREPSAKHATDDRKSLAKSTTDDRKPLTKNTTDDRKPSPKNTTDEGCTELVLQKMLLLTGRSL